MLWCMFLAPRECTCCASCAWQCTLSRRHNRCNRYLRNKKLYRKCLKNIKGRKGGRRISALSLCLCFECDCAQRLSSVRQAAWICWVATESRLCDLLCGGGLGYTSNPVESLIHFFSSRLVFTQSRALCSHLLHGI